MHQGPMHMNLCCNLQPRPDFQELRVRLLSHSGKLLNFSEAQSFHLKIGIIIIIINNIVILRIK